MNVDLLTEALVTGAVIGVIYSLVSAGFVVLYRATGVLSFAQGGFMLLGAYLFAEFTGAPGLGLWGGLVVTALLMFAAGAVTYLLVFRRVTASNPFITSVASIGFGNAVLGLIAFEWGTGIQYLKPLVSGHVFRLGDIRVTATELIIIAICIALIGGLVAALRYTSAGHKMNAVADNPGLAAHVGISTRRVSALAWGLAAAGASLAGIAYALYASIDPSTIPNLAFLAFPAIILGGLDSIGGALVGGVLVGELQSLITVYVSSTWADPLTYVVLIAVLFVRPSGLFGKRATVRI